MSPHALSWESFETDEPGRGKSAKAPAPAPAATKATPEPRKARAAPKPAPSPAAESLETLLARARGEGRAAGFEEGAAHAEAQGQADLRLLLSDMREQLADALHARVEREEAMLTSARDLAEALLTGVAPALARRGVASEISDAVLAALREARARRVEAGDAGLSVRVAPSQLEPVRAAFAAAGIATPVDPDPDLGELAARLDWAEGEDELDLDAAIAAARAALDRHFPETQAFEPEGPETQAPDQDRRVAHG
ncbi:Flagellar biosynthesis/type III secretory pathway protein FliH [Albimonas donghaensis]|uniref:Flagellar biosynthesis/type III secretory pathway protein FliH n=1 Tax=Albimonas donghaensis TaxID=356660 RepID=A0A1H2X1R2_9RHOB|nr:hypothetical protein [Albimonas donghaensis]SDW86833.1 Flagellar biosynthesis/type III secretory pathway protein FliH [Albimonas donghaensis]